MGVYAVPTGPIRSSSSGLVGTLEAAAGGGVWKAGVEKVGAGAGGAATGEAA